MVLMLPRLALGHVTTMLPLQAPAVLLTLSQFYPFHEMPWPRAFLCELSTLHA